MIFKYLKIFSQNVQKNNLIINTILEVKVDLNIIFIQEPSWTTIHTIPSSRNCEEKSLVGTANHPNWLTFSRSLELESDYSRVVIYINIKLLPLWFSLSKNVINYKDILLVSFFNKNNTFWLMNIYSDLSHTALKYLKDTEICIWNLLNMTSNFNICDSL